MLAVVAIQIREITIKKLCMANMDRLHISSSCSSVDLVNHPSSSLFFLNWAVRSSGGRARWGGGGGGRGGRWGGGMQHL